MRAVLSRLSVAVLLLLLLSLPASAAVGCVEPPNNDIFVTCYRPDGEAGWPSEGFDLQYSYATTDCSDPTQPSINVTGTTKVSIRTTFDSFETQVTQDAPICPNDAIGGFTLAYAGTLTGTLRNFAGGTPPVSVCNASTTVLGECGCGLHTGTAEQDKEGSRPAGQQRRMHRLTCVLARLQRATDRKHCCQCRCVGGAMGRCVVANQHSPELGVPPSCCPPPTTVLHGCAAPPSSSVSVSCQRPPTGWALFSAAPDIQISPTPCGTASISVPRVEVVEIEFTKRPSSRGYCALDESVALRYEYTSQLRAPFGVEATGGVVCTPDISTERGPLLGAATARLQACRLVCASSWRVATIATDTCMQHSHTYFSADTGLCSACRLHG